MYHFAVSVQIMIYKDASLIPFNEKHIEKTFVWASDPEIRRLFLMRGVITWEGHQQYFSKALSDPRQKIYAILNEAKVHVGNCGLKNILPSEGELWIYIGEPCARGKGLGAKATRLLLQEGFQRFCLSMIYLHVADFNVRARVMYKNMGFLEVPLGAGADDWTDRGGRIIRMELVRGHE